MKIVKDPEGYFVLDSKNQKVELYLEGQIVQKVDQLLDISASFWYKNYKDDIVNTPYETIIDNEDKSFKSLKYSIINYLRKHK